MKKTFIDLCYTLTIFAYFTPKKKSFQEKKLVFHFLSSFCIFQNFICERKFSPFQSYVLKNAIGCSTNKQMVKMSRTNILWWMQFSFIVCSILFRKHECVNRDGYLIFAQNVKSKQFTSWRRYFKKFWSLFSLNRAKKSNREREEGFVY